MAERNLLNESVAESLLRQLFEGDVQVMLAGNPITCERLECRIQAFFEWRGKSPEALDTAPDPCL